MECDFVQGFLMSHALPIEQALALISNKADYRALLMPAAAALGAAG